MDTILGYMDDIYVQQIPEKLRKLFKEKKAKSYVIKINPTIPLQKQNLKKDTLAILAALNYNYWCTDENEKKELLQKYTDNEMRYQRILKKVYNSDKIFEKRNSMQKTQKTNTELIEKKENVFLKIWNKIKTTFTTNEKTIKINPQNILETTDKNGNKIKILPLLYFTLKTDNKDYIVYTDTSDKENKTIYTSMVVKNKNEIRLERITDRKIIEEVTEIIKQSKFKI